MTNRCSLRCDYCYLHKSRQDLSDERGLQAIRAIFHSAQTGGFQHVKLKYAGGEPTLVFQRLLALHDQARRLAEASGITLDGVVLSNGVAISEQMIDALQERGLRLAISLDGTGPQHDAQRHFANGRGSFKYVERSLERLARHGLHPSITVTLSSRNLESLPETIRYLLEGGLLFSLNFYRENECARPYEDLQLEEQRLIEALSAAYQVIEQHLPAHSLLNSLADLARMGMPHDLACGVGYAYLVIDQTGAISRCHMEMDQPLTKIDDPDALERIRNSPLGTQNISVDQKAGCCECQWRYWCAGGCPKLTFRMTGRCDVPSPNCRIYQAVFPKILRLEGLRLLRFGQSSQASN
jgi:uncharacterized protein